MSQVFKCADKFNIMISYSHQDSELMLRIRDLLSANGFDVWVDTKLKGGSNFFNNIGSAVIGCDIFIFILTEHSISSKFCQDEVSLARISTKKILPITYCNVMDLIPTMDAGLRLILSCVQWICLDPEQDDEHNNKQFVQSINDTLHSELSDDSRLAKYDILVSEEFGMGDRERTRVLRRSESMHLTGFWSRNVGDKVDVTQLKKIFEAIKKDYGYDYTMLKVDDAWALKALALWCFDLERNALTLTREQYNLFIFPNGNPDGLIEDADRFWVRCKDGFSIRLSMQEVFDTESSVRYDSIQNLSKIKSKRVISALYKLLKTADPNIRAVACISLSHTDVNNQMSVDKIMKLLDDSDRLVRESACLALARFKAPKSIPTLLKVWRNDMISDVRNAAVKALESIGSPEALEGMRVVKTLQDEFKKLSTDVEEAE